MAIIIAEGIVEVTGDGRKVTSQVAKDIDASGAPIEQAGTGMGRKLIGGLVAVGAVAGVANWLSGAVTGASDLNETVSKSSVIFGDSAGIMNEWGNQAARQVGLSKEAALGAAAGFGDMFSQLGFASEAAAGMSIKTVSLAADLGSFSNLDTADVADRMSAAFRGEYDSLQSVIPNINAARVESEALAATGKKTAKELTAQEKATAVLSIVSKDGARAVGDFAKTSDGFANQTKISTAQLSDMQAEVGTALLPMMQDLMSFMLTNVIPGFKDVASWVGENIGMLKGVGGAILIAAGAWAVMTGALAAYNGIMGIVKAVTVAGSVAQWALNVAMSANPIGIVIGLIALLVGGIVWVATQTTFFQDAWAVMSTAIGAAFTWLWEVVLSPVFTAIGAVFTWLYENVITPIVTGIMIYVGLWAAIFTWLWNTVLSPIFAAIGKVFAWLFDNVIMPVVNSIIASVKAWGAIFSWLNSTIIQPVFAALGVAFNWIWANVISPVAKFISGAITNVGSTVKSVFGGISGFIGSAFQAVLGVVRGPLNALISLINGVIGGLNTVSVSIPDWVPVVGGQTFGLNIPRIPMLARGTNNAPDTFIAGEAGPELITGAGGSTVRPYSATQDLLTGAGRGDTYNLGGVTIPADSVDDFVKLIEIFKNMTQTARQGRGTSGMVTP